MDNVNRYNVGFQYAVSVGITAMCICCYAHTVRTIGS